MSAPDPSNDPAVPVPAPEPIPDAPSRFRLGSVAVWLALIVFPSLLALAVLASKFQGLRLVTALEHAQIARHVAAGHGFVTDSIRPLSLSLRPSSERHPDLYHAPLHPLLLGAAYALFHPSDRLSAVLGLGLWILSVVLTFVLARRWFRPGVAGLAAAFYACNAMMLRASLQGLPHPLAALFVLGFVATLLPRERPEGDAGAAGIGMRPLLGGLCCALAALTLYPLFFLAPVAAVVFVAASHRKGRALLLFLAGFLAALSPWILRNFHYGRSPLFSLYWYETLAGTVLYPGDSVWRSLNALSTGPVEFAVLHPVQMVRKAAAGLLTFWQEALPHVDPVVAFLFAAALLGERLAPRERRAFRVAAAGLLACVAAALFVRADPSLLLAWTPLLAIGAAAQAASWMSDAVERLSMKSTWKVPAINALFHSPDRVRRAVRRLALVGLLAAVGFPLFHYLWIFRPAQDSLAADMAVLREQVPEKATVLTDQPAAVAWYGPRRAIWIFQEETSWDAIVRGGAPIDAAYVTPAIGALATPEGWWWWLVSPRGIFRDLEPRDPLPSRSILRVRRSPK